MDTRRLILFVIFSFSIMMLWDAWQQKNQPDILPQQQAEQKLQAEAAGSNKTAGADGAFSLEQGQRVKVSTDLFEAEIDTTGGDLRRLILKKHRAAHINDGN